MKQSTINNYIQSAIKGDIGRCSVLEAELLNEFAFSTREFLERVKLNGYCYSQSVGCLFSTPENNGDWYKHNEEKNILNVEKHLGHLLIESLKERG